MKYLFLFSVLTLLACENEQVEVDLEVIKKTEENKKMPISPTLSAEQSTKEIDKISTVSDKRGRPTKQYLKPVIMGPITKEEITKAIQAKSKDMQNCYQSDLEKYPKLKGKLIFRFVFSGAGEVNDISIHTNEFHSLVAENCMLDVLKSVTVPTRKFKGITIVRYPFVFSPDT